MAPIKIGKPFSYYEGEASRLGLDLTNYQSMKLLEFKVGDRSYPVITSPTDLRPGTTALKDAYVNYWTGRANDEVLANHLASVSKVSTLRFRPASFTDSSLCIVDISDGLINRPARGNVFEERLEAKVLKLFRALNNHPFTNVGIGEALRSIGLSSKQYSGYGGRPDSLPSASGGLAIQARDMTPTNVKYYVEPSYFERLVFPYEYGPQHMGPSNSTMFNPWFARVCPNAYSEIATVINTKSGGGHAQLTQWTRSDMVYVYMSQLITLYPKLGEFKALLENKLGLSAGGLVWDSIDDKAGNIALIVPDQKYTACKSLALGPVSFELRLDTLAPTEVEWQFHDEELVKTGVQLSCECIHTMYNLDVVVDKITASEQTATLKQFVVDHPGSAVVYSYSGRVWNDNVLGPLEQTTLYKDAMDASFDLYSQILWGTTTFKTASNKAKAHCAGSNPMLSVRTNVFPQLTAEIRINDYGSTVWNFSTNGIVTGSFNGSSVVLNAANAEEKDDVEAALILGVTKVFETTETEFCQLWFGVSTPSAISVNSSSLAGVDYNSYELDPNVLSPDGTTSRSSLTDDQYKRLIFVHANTSTTDLTSLVEGAIAMHFIV